MDIFFMCTDGKKADIFLTQIQNNYHKNFGYQNSYSELLFSITVI